MVDTLGVDTIVYVGNVEGVGLVITDELIELLERNMDSEIASEILVNELGSGAELVIAISEEPVRIIDTLSTEILVTVAELIND